MRMKVADEKFKGTREELDTETRSREQVGESITDSILLRLLSFQRFSRLKTSPRLKEANPWWKVNAIFHDRRRTYISHDVSRLCLPCRTISIGFPFPQTFAQARECVRNFRSSPYSIQRFLFVWFRKFSSFNDRWTFDEDKVSRCEI